MTFERNLCDESLGDDVRQIVAVNLWNEISTITSIIKSHAFESVYSWTPASERISTSRFSLITIRGA